MQTTGRHKIVLAVLVGLIVCGIARSAIATRLDSFDLDEAYHITAGVAYARLGDYRLNPEHPPLVKLWVGAFMPNDFTTPKLRPMSEKWDERHFTEFTVFEQNDADLAQRYARIAMFALNGILLLAFALSVWRAFGSKAGPAMAIGALAFLVVDPSTAAHLPVVLTDLPAALLASTAVLLAWTAFRSGRLLDTSLAALALGCTLGAKHTGLIVAVAVAILGAVMAVRNVENRPRLWRMGQILLVLVLASITLWGMYRFRFNESAEGLDLFNRPLATKIADLHRPWLQQSVTLMARVHLFPRAYIWGLADILHVGIEGRVAPFYFINRYYMVSAPWYFFPTILLVRLPLGLLALALVGLVLAVRNRTWSGREPLFVLVSFGTLMLLMLMRGKSSYAGIRHALFVVPPLAVLAGTAFTIALEKKKLLLNAGLAVAAIAALASAIPVMRPWEYYNELVGGKDNAWHYFSDEGLDSGQRAKELAAYYHQYLEPKGETPFDSYFESYSEDIFRKVPTLQQRWKDNPAADTSDVISGTLMVPAGSLAPNPFTEYGPLRDAQPVARFGNLMIYRGSFALPGPRATRFADRALDAEFSDHPDLAFAQQLLTKSLELAPGVYYRWIALGNVLMQRGERDQAIQAFENAAKYVPPGDEMVEPIQTQIQRLSRDDLKKVPLLRNPVLE
jgi:tetratricopeptide (TPR) repeat protein